MRARVTASLLVAAALLGGCSLPRDTEGTLDRVRDGGTLRVGLSEEEDLERDALAAFARRQGARLDVERGPLEELVERLRAGELDVVAGGATKRSPFKKDVAPTVPFRGDRVMFVRNGENAMLVTLERFLLDREGS